MNDYQQNIRDYKILVITLIVLISFGMIMLFSASSRISFYKFDNTNTIFFHHLTRMFAAALVGIAFYLINYKFLKKLNVFFFTASILILLFPLIGKWVSGDTFPARWIHVGSFTFQTAEIARFSLIIFFANYISKNQKKLHDFQEGFLPVTGILMVFIPPGCFGSKFIFSKVIKQ